MDNKIITRGSSNRYFPSTQINNMTDVVKVSPDLDNVGKLVKDNRVEPLRDFITLLVIDVFGFYGENINDEFREILIEKLLEELNLNCADFQLFKKFCFSGKYKYRTLNRDGSGHKITFYRLNPSVFVEWFAEYCIDRGQEFALSNSNSNKLNINNGAPDLNVLKCVSEIVSVKSSKENLSQPLEESKIDTQSKELQKFLQNEFQKLWHKQGKMITISGTKYVNYKRVFNEKKINFTRIETIEREYIEFRYNEIYESIRDDYQNEKNKFESAKITNPELKAPVWEEFIYSRINTLLKTDFIPN